MNAAVVGNGACKHQRPSRSPLIDSQGRWAVLKTNLQDSLDWRLGEWGRQGGKLSFSSEGKKDKGREETSDLLDWAGNYFPHLHPGRWRSPGAHSGSFSSSPEPVWALGGAPSLRVWAGLWWTAPAWDQERPGNGQFGGSWAKCVYGWGEREGQLPGPRLPLYLGYESWDRMERFGTLGERRSEKKKKESGRSAGWSRAGRGGRGEARPGQGINAVSGAAGARAESCCLASPPGPPPRVSGT